MPPFSLPTLPTLSRLGPTATRDSRYQDQEEDLDPGTLQKIGAASLGGISRLGNLLDLPASMARDVFSTIRTGNWENPFDQLLSPTTSKNRVSGRELNRSFDLAGRQDTWKNFMGGLLTEVALDPLTYATFGISALSKGGKILRKAGVLDHAMLEKVGRKPSGKFFGGGAKLGQVFGDMGVVGKRTARSKTKVGDIYKDLTPDQLEAVKRASPAGVDIEDLLDEKIGSSMRFGLGSMSVGRTSRTVDQLMDTLGNTLAYGKIGDFSPGGKLQKAFSRSAGGSSQEVAIKSHRIFDSTAELNIAKAREELGEHIEPIDKMMKDAAGREDEDAVLAITEYLEWDDAKRGGTYQLPDHLKEIVPNLDALKDWTKRQYHDDKIAGLDISALDDLVNAYFPRLRETLGKVLPRIGVDAKVYSTMAPQHLGRKFKHTSTKNIQEMSVNPKYSGGKHRHPDEYQERYEEWRREYGEQLPSKAINEDANKLLDARHYARDLRRAELEGKPNLKADGEPLTTADYESILASEGLPPGIDDIYPDLDKTTQAADKELFNTIWRLDKLHADGRVPIFKTNPVEAATRNAEASIRARESANHIYSTAAEMGAQTKLDPDLVPMSQVIDNAGLSRVHGEKAFLEQLKKTNEGLWKAIHEDGPSIGRAEIEEAVNAGRLTDVEAIAKLKNLNFVPGELAARVGVPRQVADDAARMMKGFQSPEPAGTFLALLDKLTNFFKAGVTSIFPAFHARNFISGHYQNYIGGAFGMGTGVSSAQYIGAVTDTFRLLTKRDMKSLGDIPGFEGMSREAATKKFALLLHTHRVSGNNNFLNDLLGQDFSDAVVQSIPNRSTPLREEILKSRHLGDGPGRAIPGGKPIFDHTRAAWRNPDVGKATKVGGFAWGKTKGAFAETDEALLPALGRDIGNFTEATNRIAPFISFLRQGMDPGQAARKVKALQVDYSNLSNFERQWMRRVFPFYSFSRGVIPFHIEELTARPGGRLGKTLRALRLGRPEAQVLPQHISETAAIPLPGKEDERPSYLTGLGLMFEDPISFAPGGSPGLEALSRLNPMIKGPLEALTNQSFFQRGPLGGRPLGDMDPIIGRTLSNVQQMLTGEKVPTSAWKIPKTFEHFMANTPYTRLLTTGKTLSDVRPEKTALKKVFNLGLGIKTTTMTEAAQDAMVREKASELMRAVGAKEFTRTYFPNPNLEAMSPEAREHAEGLKVLIDQLAKRGKARKAAQ